MEELKQYDKTNIVELRDYRYTQIDKRTGELILEGFEYPTSSGKIFSFSENAQRNLLGAYVGRAFLTYPRNWNTKDDSETYQIADATEMEAFYLTALSSKASHQDSGTAVKTQIREANDIASINAIIDNR